MNRYRRWMTKRSPYCWLSSHEMASLQKELLRESRERVGGLQIPTHLITTLEAEELPEDFIASEHEKIVNSGAFLQMQRTRKKSEVSLSDGPTDSGQFIHEAILAISLQFN